MRRLGCFRGRPARGAQILLVTLALGLSSCTGGGGGSDSPAAGPSPAEVENARAVLGAADLDDGASIGAVGGLRFTEAGLAAARSALEEGATGDERWAATWVYATSPTDSGPLRPLLGDPEPSIRLMAAAGMVRLGEAAGFDVLIDLLAIDAPVAGSHPPVPMWQYVGSVLARLTGVDLGPTAGSSPDQVAKAAAAWAGWLEENRASLQFDGGSGTWSVM